MLKMKMIFIHVQELRDRRLGVVCIPVSDIECTVGIFLISSRQGNILDRNWIDFDPYEREHFLISPDDQFPAGVIYSDGLDATVYSISVNDDCLY
ncbi:hypothetical protein V1517DRAFT_331199 [Lipomyces orientalis]|uniref:Uncharacterized protein n=1 Tax=Lipomyces orientalis TaxID=1233043 RepID=A0ACC3TG43_9ASCO